MKRKINVTQEDIDLGVRMEGRFCPIARAIKRQTGKSCAVAVWSMVFDGECILLPEKCTSFVSMFDSTGCGGVRPFSFEFEDSIQESLTDYTEVLATEPLVTEVAHEQVHCHHDAPVGADCQGILAS